MTRDLSGLYAKPKQYLIGKDLPDDQKVAIDMYSPGLDDLDLLAELNKSKETFSDGTLSMDMKVMRKLIAKIMRKTEEEIAQIDAGFFEEIMDAFEDRMKSLEVTDERKERVKKQVEEMKARAATKSST